MIELVVPKEIKAITVDKKIILNDESELELVYYLKDKKH
jgi:hypothetical protein